MPPAVIAPLPIIPPHEIVQLLPTVERILQVPASLISVPQMQAGTPWSGPTSQQLPLVAGPEEHAIAVTEAAATVVMSHPSALLRTFTARSLLELPRDVRGQWRDVVWARTSPRSAFM